MTFLSVARRELQAAARRRGTFRVRLGSAVLATLIAAFMLMVLSATGAARQAGQGLFGSLVFLAFAFAGLAGVFLAADAISEERRGGTLGLLFLAPINGFDVVAGKLTAVGLNALYGLMAAFPIIAAAWFLGGVTAGEFWRTLLVLTNTLFVSLGGCLWISARAREQSEALARAALLLIGLGVGLPVLVAGATRLGGPAWLGHLDAVSPPALIEALTDTAYQSRPFHFWQLLALQHGIAWGALAWAGWRLQSDWKDRPERTSPGAHSREEEAGARRRQVNRRWLDTDPIRALMARGTWLPRAVWLLGGMAVLIGLCFVGVAWNATRTPGSGAGPATPVTLLASFLPYGFTALRLGWKALFAWESCAFFAEARRTGSLDLLLTTPVKDDELLGAHRRHLGRTFLLPAVLIFLAELSAGIGIVVLGRAPTLTGFNLLQLMAAQVSMAIQAEAMTAAGAWFALTGNRATTAFGKTLTFGALLPGLFCCVGWIGSGILAAWARKRLSPGIRRLLAGDIPRFGGSAAAYGPTQR